MNERNQQIVMENIPSFIRELRSEGYSELSVVEHEKVLVLFLDFLHRKEHAHCDDMIGEFLKWKMARRAKRSYCSLYRTKVFRYVEDFIIFCLSSSNSLIYKRQEMECQIEPFLETCRACIDGKTPRANIDRRNGLLAFFEYLDREGFEVFKEKDGYGIDPAIVKSFIKDRKRAFYLKRQKLCQKYERKNRLALTRYHDFLRSKGHLSFALPKVERRQRMVFFSQIIDNYLQYLDRVGLSASTIDRNQRELTHFDWYLQDQGVVSLNRVSISNLDQFVRTRCSATNLKGIHRINSTLRRFFKYLYVSDLISRDISAYIVAAPCFRLSDVPKFLTEDELKAILNFPKPLSKTAIKEKAILAVILMNGLRIGEVAGLTLDDIDWDKKLITVRNRKNNTPLITILAAYTQAALMEYITEARPAGREERNIFFTSLAPIKPLNSRAITQVMRRLLRKNSITFGGGHRIRHTFATHALESGSSLENVAELMGHNSISSSQIYVKSSMRRMREHVVNDEV
jgi:integrase/recombinase XerD